MTKKIPDHIEWEVSAITNNNRRIQSSDLLFDTDTQAKKWIKSKKATKFAEEHNVIEFRISKETVSFEQDIETFPLEVVKNE